MNQAFVADPVFLDPVYEPLEPDYEEMREKLRTPVMVSPHYGTIARSLRWSRNLRDQGGLRHQRSLTIDGGFTA